MIRDEESLLEEAPQRFKPRKDNSAWVHDDQDQQGALQLKLSVKNEEGGSFRDLTTPMQSFLVN